MPIDLIFGYSEANSIIHTHLKCHKPYIPRKVSSCCALLRIIMYLTCWSKGRGSKRHSKPELDPLIVFSVMILFLTILGTDGTNHVRFQFVFAIVITILVAGSLILATLAYIKAVDSGDCIKKEELRNMLKLEGGLANNKTSMIPTGTRLSLKKKKKLMVAEVLGIFFYQATLVPVTDRQTEIPICSLGTASNEKISNWPFMALHYDCWYFQDTQTQYSLQRSTNTSSLYLVMKLSSGILHWLTQEETTTSSQVWYKMCTSMYLPPCIALTKPAQNQNQHLGTVLPRHWFNAIFCWKLGECAGPYGPNWSNRWSSILLSDQVMRGPLLRQTCEKD